MLGRLTRAQSFLLGAFLAAFFFGCAAVTAAALVVGLGWYDVSASKPHWLVTAWALHTTMIHAVQDRAAAISTPSRFSADQVREGFEEYEVHCVMCHGGPGISRSQWVMGLEPSPPYLIDAARRWSPAELKVIISHGVKMTAMPAWELTQPDSKIWSLVAFLEKLPDITPAQYSKMRAGHESSAPGLVEGADSRHRLGGEKS